MDEFSRIESLQVANKAVAACLRTLSQCESYDVDFDEILYMLACVLMHPEILI